LFKKIATGTETINSPIPKSRPVRFGTAGAATRDPSRRPLIAALFVFLIAAVGSGLLVQRLEAQRLQEQRASLAEQASTRAQSIQRNTERALSATYALAALVREGQGRVPNFDAIAAQMLPFYPGAASLQLAPGGVIQHIVPLAGNEKAMGHNLLQDPARDKEAFKARDTGKLTLAGPFNLVQGGLGAVGRLPVFLDDALGQPAFWGFTTVLVRFPETLADAQLSQLAQHGLGYELWRLHPDSGKKQTIAVSGPGALIEPVTQTLEMPNGRWLLSIAPLNGWGDPLGLLFKATLGLLFSLLLAYLAKLLLELRTHKQQLEVLVAQRTAEISATQLKLQTTFDAIPDQVWLKDEHGVYLDCNPMFARFYGVAKADLLGKTDDVFVGTALAEVLRAHDRQTIADGKPRCYEEWLNYAEDGRRGLFETTKAPMRDAAGTLIGVLGISHDITARHAAEARIQRLTRLYSALSQCNQAIVRCTSEAELFPQTCRDVVQFGGMKLAWIGLVDARDGLVKPVACFGEGVNYLNDIQISANAQEPRGRGPVGLTIRERQPVWIADYLQDPRTEPWHALGTQAGWGSCAALPLQRNGEVVGVFTLYAAEPLAFDEEDVRGLLVEMAADISYALDSFDRETAREQAVAALCESEERYRALIERTPESILVHRLGQVLYVNPAAIRMFGATAAQELIGKWTSELIHPDFREAQTARMHSIIEHAPIQPMVESRFLQLDGVPIDVEVQGTSVVYDGQPAIQVSVRNISERKQAEAKLRLSASVFTHAREGIMITRADGIIIDVNDAFTRITGYSREEALGRNPRLLSSGRQKKEFYAAMWQELAEHGHWYGEVWNRNKNGEVYAAMQTVSAVADAQGEATQYVALFSDITAVKEHQRQLEHIAHYDLLTSLPNRVLLADRLHQGMSQAQRRAQRLAVVFLDLDGFKAVNDQHGHDAGDQLLIAVASRMKQTLRDGDTLARLGGDEFVAVLVDLGDVEACVPMLARLLAAAAQPILFGEHQLQVSASLGVTFYPQADDIDADQLLRQADQAMYQAKLLGKNRFHLFDTEQDRSVRGHHEIIERIRLALEAQEFVLYYQPKVNMRSGKVVGAEALIRWQHPEKGLLLPAMFLPVIEEHALAVEIGEWVIASALSQMALWKAAGLNLPVSVNVGARQLQQADFAQRLSVLLAAQPSILPGDLELEVLETSALEELAHVSRVIEGCRKIGVLFALDDFGTGYSSLTYLKHLPVNQLKIDQSFVRDMLEDPDDLAILQGVIGLASAFRREVIAEGVESVAHGAMLLQLGCELGQGYGIARPMPAQQLRHWAASWRPAATWADSPAVSRDDLPLLYAGVEHRAWIAAMENHLRGEREAPPAQDQHQCRFGRWLAAEGRARHGAHPAFQAILPLHQQVHELTQVLCDLHAQGRSRQALARLAELHDLRDALLAQLRLLTLSRQP
jgi:diguanylate cyclase (GGDEF)-like protein/PAS domain S-box-containing protein